jgi:hypothetical protein
MALHTSDSVEQTNLSSSGLEWRMPMPDRQAVVKAVVHFQR